MFECYAAGTRNQTFLLAGDGDGDGLRDGAFTISVSAHIRVAVLGLPY
jgi:hypothetical protein